MYKGILKTYVPLHVSDTLVAILREVRYRGYFTEIYEPIHKNVRY
jgi:hypothetical protein